MLRGIILNDKTSGANNVNDMLDTAISWVMSMGLKILIIIAVVFVSFKVINYIANKIQKQGDNGRYDKTLMRTLAYIFRIGCKILIGVIILGNIGVEASSLTALLASFGIGIGLAINGALSNLAGGVIIIVSRIFKVDDFIETQGVSGTVEDIRILCTRIVTPDNKVIYIPNGSLIGGNIINYSEKGTRRADFTFSIAYENNFEKAKSIIMDICNAHELILQDPAPFVRVGEHAASSINIVTRVWVKCENYWDVRFDIIEAVKTAFNENDITIPFNQLDINVKY